MDITDKLTEGYKGDLTELYGSEYAYSLFERSYLKFFAVEEGKVTGAVRIISEGVETALLVDLKANCYNTKAALLKAAEKQLNDRRVMAYGSFSDEKNKICKINGIHDTLFVFMKVFGTRFRCLKSVI